MQLVLLEKTQTTTSSSEEITTRYAINSEEIFKVLDGVGVRIIAIYHMCYQTSIGYREAIERYKDIVRLKG